MPTAAPSMITMPASRGEASSGPVSQSAMNGQNAL